MKHPNRAKSPRRRTHGIAIVTVLFMLTMMATLAAVMVVVMRIEGESATVQLQSLKAELLLNAGLDHAKTMLNVAHMVRSEEEDPQPLPSILFGRDGTQENGARQQSPWFDVHDGNGSLYGRYRLVIEDEASKLNVNSATLLNDSKGSGWSVAEINVPTALGVSPVFAESLVNYRLGRNAVPGLRGDDDANNTWLMADGIDNNAIGLVDEQDEGVEDPGEYTYHRPRGDDRRFGSVEEVLSLLLNMKDGIPMTVQQTLMREVPRRVTIYSMDRPGSATLPNDAPSDVNTCTTREARNRLRTANKRIPFEGAARRLDELAANIVDYRDQNHVLSTVGAAYGVEAVCFNELLANDGTEFRFLGSCMNTWFQRGNYAAEINDDEFAVSTASLFHDFVSWRNTSGAAQRDVPSMDELHYNFAWDNWNLAREGAWDCEVSPGGGAQNDVVKILGPAMGQGSAGFYPLWHDNNQNRRQRYDEYKRMRNSIGEYSFRSVRGKPGFRTAAGEARVSYESPTWPVDFFKNQYITLAFCLSNSWDTRRSGNRNKSDDRLIKSTNGKTAVRIIGSDREGVLTLEKRLNMSAATQFEGHPTRCVIWGWETALMARAWEPDMITRHTVKGLEPGKYYLPIVNGVEDERGLTLGFAPENDIWNDNRTRIDDRRQWYYGGQGDDAAYLRASSGMGAMDVYIKSGRDVRLNRPQELVGLIFLRPEVMELINVSPNPISLKNWTLTFNTGTIANDIGRIGSCYGYSPRGGSTMSNPMIDGNGYFYMVNDVRLFNSEFGTGVPQEWGRNAGQQVPVWEIPHDSWGVQYRITGYKTDNSPYSESITLYTRNERFETDQFAGEVLELRDTRGGDGDKDAGHGTRYGVAGNSANSFTINAWTIGWMRDRFNPNTGCDTMMLVGMPAKGGVVSMTLKNEYKQITSRTIEYDYLNQDPDTWYGRSVEKIDPTHYNWRVVQRPSISGRPRGARNRSMSGSEALDAVIKNGPFNSVAELQQVRSSRDFENIGAGRASGESLRTMSALASVFGNSHIRLEAGDEECARAGWEIAGGRVQSSGPGTITAERADWESDQWEDQTVRFLTGRLRGESFPVGGNTRVSLNLRDPDVSGREKVPYSSPGRQSLSPSRGDIFTLGPGYASPLCYTRRSNDEGTWTWRSRIPVPGEYDLYIFGLSDSINTTEFLEENNNSAIDVLVYNYRTDTYDKLVERGRYGKEDSFPAGRIGPQHVNAAGDFRLRLVSHDVTEDDAPDDASGVTSVSRQRTGYCWFNYAVLTPVPVFGRVNVNTASVRVLSSLPGINRTLAQAIVNGLDSNGRAVLKPYKQLGDLLKVKGMTLEAFERFANLVMLESYTYTVSVEAQAFDRVGLDSETLVQDDVASQQNMRYIIELVKGDDGNLATHVLEQTRL